jgi:hypothetical protein
MIFRIVGYMPKPATRVFSSFYFASAHVSVLTHVNFSFYYLLRVETCLPKAGTHSGNKPFFEKITFYSNLIDSKKLVHVDLN